MRARTRGPRGPILIPRGGVRHHHPPPPRHHALLALGDPWLSTTGLSAPVGAPTPPPFLSGAPVRAADSGWGHSALVTADGGLTLLGRPTDFRNTLRHINTRGALSGLQGFMTRLSAALFPSETAPLALPPPPGDEFAAVSCGVGALTLATTTGGALYAVGANFYGQCGHGVEADEICGAPVRVVGFDPQDGPVLAASAGFEHGLAVTQGGAVYAWGRGDRGQLGSGDRGSFKAAVRVLGARDELLGRVVVGVEAGLSSSAAVTSDGCLWVWGKMGSTRVREKRADGGVLLEDQLDPRRVLWEGEVADGDHAVSYDPPPPAPPGSVQPGRLGAGVVMGCGGPPRVVVAATCGHAHTSFLTSDGRLWMIGLRGRGQLYDDTDPASPTCRVLPLQGVTSPGALLRGAVGGGRSPAGLPDLPEVFMQLHPWEVPPGGLGGRRIVALSSSSHHSFAVDDEGGLWRWGWRGVVARVEEVDGVRVAGWAPGYASAWVLLA